MRRIILLTVGLILLTGMVGAVSVDQPSWQAEDEDGVNITESDVIVGDEVIELTERVDRVDVTHVVNQTDVDIVVDTALIEEFDDQSKVVYKDNQTIAPNVTTQNDRITFGFTLRDQVDAEDEYDVTVGNQSYDVRITRDNPLTGTIGDLPGPFEDFGAGGLLLFIGLVLGLIVTGGMIIYFLVTKNLSRRENTGSLGVLALGSIGSTFADYWWILVLVLFLFVGLTVYLYRSGITVDKTDHI